MSRVPLTLQLGNTIVSNRFRTFKHEGEIKQISKRCVECLVDIRMFMLLSEFGEKIK